MTVVALSSWHACVTRVEHQARSSAERGQIGTGTNLVSLAKPASELLVTLPLPWPDVQLDVLEPRVFAALQPQVYEPEDPEPGEQLLGLTRIW
jgi:hypothetical protein